VLGPSRGKYILIHYIGEESEESLMPPAYGREPMSLAPQVTQPFVYTRILTSDTIRLFYLDKDTSNVISGRFKITTISDAPPYLALSYCWANQKQDVPIHCDGKVLLVTKSVVHALQRLRTFSCANSEYDLSFKWVWVDMICINQGDITEVSNQVKLMGSIYSQAIRTIIWLGPIYDSCHHAWTLIDKFYKIFQRESPNARYLADIPIGMYSADQHASHGLPSWDDDLWKHLRTLFDVPWFTRTWVIQEVALSRQDPIILHGCYAYPWHQLGWASSWLRRSGYLRLDQIPSQIQNVDTIANIRRSHSRWRLDALLVATSLKFHATDQRDKVFGLLGLAAETQDPAQWPAALVPDYDQDTQQVYRKVAEYFMREYKSLAILTRSKAHFAQIFQSSGFKVDRLPSWVPNWSDFFEDEPVRSLSWLSYSNTGGATDLGFPKHYNAAAGLPAKLENPVDDEALRIHALKSGIVTLTATFNLNRGSPLHESRFIRRALKKSILLESYRSHAVQSSFLRFWKMAVKLGKQMRTSDLIYAFIKSTTADQYRLSGRSAEQIRKDGSAYLFREFEKEQIWRKQYRWFCLPLRSQSDIAIDRIPPIGQPSFLDVLKTMAAGGSAESFAALARNFCFNRSFFVTSDGRLGIGPAEIRRGDTISIIFGGAVPYILRAQGTHYVLIGESYVHGLMDGQAVDAWHSGEVEDEVLVLR
jgi:hypothetical protein